MPQECSPEFKARALNLIEERIQAEQCSGWVACTAVGEALGGSPRIPWTTGGSRTASITARLPG